MSTCSAMTVPREVTTAKPASVCSMRWSVVSAIGIRLSIEQSHASSSTGSHTASRVYKADPGRLVSPLPRRRARLALPGLDLETVFGHQSRRAFQRAASSASNATAKLACA